MIETTVVATVIETTVVATVIETTAVPALEVNAGSAPMSAMPGKMETARK